MGKEFLSLYEDRRFDAVQHRAEMPARQLTMPLAMAIPL